MIVSGEFFLLSSRDAYIEVLPTVAHAEPPLKERTQAQRRADDKVDERKAKFLKVKAQYAAICRKEIW